ncbi:MAG: hypothetical protein KDD82_00160 [Planctomycetes bacterium]|nr:hypothetical protein [Planctomycetota bacterium]
MPRLVTVCLLALAPTLVGCVGSPNPYKPGYQPRPPEVTQETEVAATVRKAIPSDLMRADWRRRLEEREINALYERSSSHNAYFAYEADMLEVLGPEEAARYLGGRSASQEAAPLDEGDEGGGDEYGDEGGGDEYGDEGGADEYGDDY